MKHRQLLLISFFCLINLTIPCVAKDWHNIFPLKTTRGEVLKLLGNPQKNEAEKSEYFEVENNIVKIRWIRSDCYGKDARIDAEKADSDALVYQITVNLKVPLELKDFTELNEPKIESEKSNESKNDAKYAYYRWMSQDVNCLIGGDKSACSILDSQKGFGYSSLGGDVTALYYFPSEKESIAWKEKHTLCVPNQK